MKELEGGDSMTLNKRIYGTMIRNAIDYSDSEADNLNLSYSSFKIKELVSEVY